jgi:hypothetical protein
MQRSNEKLCLSCCCPWCLLAPPVDTRLKISAATCIIHFPCAEPDSSRRRPGPLADRRHAPLRDISCLFTGGLAGLFCGKARQHIEISEADKGAHGRLRLGFHMTCYRTCWLCFRRGRIALERKPTRGGGQPGFLQIAQWQLAAELPGLGSVLVFRGDELAGKARAAAVGIQARTGHVAWFTHGEDERVWSQQD